MELLKQCKQWFEQDEAQKVIDTLEAIHAEERIKAVLDFRDDRRDVGGVPLLDDEEIEGDHTEKICSGITNLHITRNDYLYKLNRKMRFFW